MNKKATINELIGKYLNGYKIVRIEKDPFIKGQINLWTDEERIGTFGDRSIVKFFVREDSNSSKVYQEIIDKKIYEMSKEINDLKILIVCMRYGLGLNEEQIGLLEKVSHGNI